MLERVAFVAWSIGAVVAAGMGVLLLLGDVGDRVGPWYAAFGLGCALVAVAVRRLGGPTAGTVIVVAATGLVGTIVIHTVVVAGFAYSGLSNIIVVLSVVAGILTVAAVRRGRQPWA